MAKECCTSATELKVTLPKASSVSWLIHNFDKMPKDNSELTVFTSILGT